MSACRFASTRSSVSLASWLSWSNIPRTDTQYLHRKNSNHAGLPISQRHHSRLKSDAVVQSQRAAEVLTSHHFGFPRRLRLPLLIPMQLTLPQNSFSYHAASSKGYRAIMSTYLRSYSLLFILAFSVLILFPQFLALEWGLVV